MKKSFLILTLLPFAHTHLAASTDEQSATKQVAQQQQLTPNQQQIVNVGTNFANIVFNALSIIGNKDNSEALSHNLSGIMNSFVNIAIEASKNKVDEEHLKEVLLAIKVFCENLNEEEVDTIIKTINKYIPLDEVDA